MRQLAAVDVHPAHFGAAMQQRHCLAGIEQAFGVERALDRMKALELGRGELRAHLIDLFETDAVLSGDRTTDLDAKLENPRAERFRPGDLIGNVGVIEDQWMQIAVAGMEYIHAAQAEFP